MVDLFLYSALSFGGVAGAIGGMEIISWRNRKRISTQIKKRVGCESFLSARSIFVESRGLNYWIIQKMVLFSDDHVNLIKGTSLFPWALGLNNKETLIQKSGLLGIVNEKGIFSIRLTLSFFWLYCWPVCRSLVFGYFSSSSRCALILLWFSLADTCS